MPVDIGMRIDIKSDRAYSQQVLIRLTYLIRCLLLRCPAPTKTEITEVLDKVSSYARIHLPPIFAANLAKACDGINEVLINKVT